jgi:hypothetical protein
MLGVGTGVDADGTIGASVGDRTGENVRVIVGDPVGTGLDTGTWLPDGDPGDAM